MSRTVDVSAGVLIRADGRFLLGQRAEGSFYPGYWEFPGGKVEPGETPAEALIRELHEELGIRVTALAPWLVRVHHYDHALVRLHFFEVSEWQGAVDDKVHSALSWEQIGAMSVGPMLPANGPILKALALPRMMIGIDMSSGLVAARSALEEALAGGCRLLCLCGEAPGPLHIDVLLGLAHQAGAIVLRQSGTGTASAIAADGLHLQAEYLMRLSSRPPGHWVGGTCRTREELLMAAQLGLDYALFKPESVLSAADWSTCIEALPLPVLLSTHLECRLSAARRAGAHGLAAI